MQIKHNISLLPYNTFGIDVLADTMVFYDSPEDLAGIIQASLQNLPRPLLHIGEGSNLLFMKDFPGTILMCENKEITVLEHTEDKVIVRVGAGLKMDDFILHSISQGWYGLENLSNIPGQVGASAVQNIGAYGVEAGEYIYAVNCLSLEDASSIRLTNEECQFAYRYSIFKSPEYKGKVAVTSVEYCLDTKFVPKVDYGGIRRSLASEGLCAESVSALELRNTIIKIREAKLPDPKKQGNAGSFFMNPIVDRDIYESILAKYPDMPRYELDNGKVKIPAAWLIEQCGWKGKGVGRAGVHSVQPLVLVNLGGAKGEDISNLSHLIQKDVFNTFGINISPEVNFI